MYKSIVKKLLLSISIGVCIGFGIFISYAVNNLSEPLISGTTLTQSWFNDLRLRVVNIVSTSSGGNVGIGMTPTQKFEVAGNIKATSFIGNVTGNVTGTASHVPWTGVTGRPTNLSSFTNDSGYLTSVSDNRINTTGDNITGNFNVSGNVGIGTTTPSQKLQVNGNIRAGIGTYGNIILDDDESPNGIKYIHANSNNIGFLSGSGSWLSRWDNAGNMVNTAGISAVGNIAANGGLSIGYGGTLPPVGGAIIAGNVGIGTPSPGSRIESYGNGVGLYSNQATASDLYIRYHIPGVRWWTVGPKANGDFWFSNSSDLSSNYSFGITSGGNVGIGTSTPTQKLEVNGNVKATSFQGDGSALTGISGTPAGAIMAFYLGSCPTGWLLANGTSGTPDLRGAFIRGMGGDANGRDIARALGNYQADTYASHIHSIDPPSTTTNANGNHRHVLDSATVGISPTNYPPARNSDWSSNGTTLAYTNYDGNHSHTLDIGIFNSSSNGGTETRPKNVALIYCMKQ